MKITIDLNARSVVRWLVGLLLIWAALSKLAHPQEFYGSLLGYKLPLPDFLLQLTAMTLPWLELLCGLMLLGRVDVQPALLWAMILFAAFIVASGQAWARGLEISCGCLDLSVIGVGPESGAAQLMKSAWFAFFRAILLLGAAVFLWRSEKGEGVASVPIGAAR